MHLKKILYGYIQSAILWCDTFKNCLEHLGFKLNLYDPYVVNKIINGKQCTIYWYVDDSKISHVNPETVDWVIKCLEEQFGKMTVNREKQHTFVGMDIVFIDEKTVQTSMKRHIKEFFEAFTLFDEEISKGATTSAKIKLFVIDKNKTTLKEEQADGFHHIVAKLLYVIKRARIGVDLTVSFLCTRVSNNDVDDWENIRRL